MTNADLVLNTLRADRRTHLPYQPEPFDLTGNATIPAEALAAHLRACKEAHEALRTIHRHIFDTNMGTGKTSLRNLLRQISAFDHDIAVEIDAGFAECKEACEHFEKLYVVQLELLHALRGI